MSVDQKKSLDSDPKQDSTQDPSDEEWRPDWTAEDIEQELSSDRPENLFAPETSVEEDEIFEEEPLTFEVTAPIEPLPSGRDTSEGLMRWDEALTLEGQIEAVLFAAPKPLSLAEIADIVQNEEGFPLQSEIDGIITSLTKLYRERNGGFRLEHDKGLGFQFRTVPAAAPLMERMFSSRQRPLSRAALETLAIIAYRQPVTRADIEYIRGVDAGSIIKNLLERELIACVGRKEDAGRPMMFGTSPEFLRVFRIQSLNELPPISAFQPAPDMMAEAMHRLEEGDAEVDVETFIEDPSEEKPHMSEGLGLLAVQDDFAASAPAFQVRDSDTQGVSEGPRSGARFDAEGIDQDDRRDKDQDSEMALSTGSSVTARSRKNADGGADLDQRPDLQGDGNED